MVLPLGVLLQVAERKGQKISSVMRGCFHKVRYLLWIAHPDELLYAVRDLY